MIVVLSAVLARTVSLSPRAHPRCAQSAQRGWAEATHVDTTRGEKRFEYLLIKLHSLRLAARVVKRVYSVSNAAVNS